MQWKWKNDIGVYLTLNKIKVIQRRVINKVIEEMFEAKVIQKLKLL